MSVLEVAAAEKTAACIHELYIDFTARRALNLPYMNPTRTANLFKLGCF